MDLDKVKKNLEAKGFKLSVFQDKKAASDYMNKEIDSKDVGFGGSMTLLEMGLADSLGAHNRVYWHWIKDSDAPAMLKGAANAEIYISSVNAISESGELVNIDGAGNRLASTIYGHRKVYFVVGSNKIAPDLESAIHRARNVAAPLNAKRLGKKTPCVKNGKCFDCKSPERICSVLSVFWQKPSGGDYEIVLINEELGY